MALTVSRSMVVVIAITVGAALAATACGATSTGETPVAVRSARSETTTTRKSHKAMVRAGPKDALATTVLLNGGQVSLSSPPPATLPTMTAQQAMTVFQSSSAYYSGLAQLTNSGMQFAILTDTTLGPQPSAGQTFTPTYIKHPAWYIEYQDVPFEPDEPPTRTATSTTVTTSSPTTDYFVVLDDLTGQVIMSVLGLPGAAGNS
jgi:hypothetical protein